MMRRAKLTEFSTAMRVDVWPVVEFGPVLTVVRLSHNSALCSIGSNSV